MSSPTDDLISLLRESNARVTLDFERDATKPCIVCGGGDKEELLPGIQKLWNHLCTVGSYIRAEAGGMRRGDPMLRPVCRACILALAAEDISCPT